MPRPTSSPALLRHQARLLRDLHDLGTTSDDSLQARLSELGISIHSTTIAQWRRGACNAPLGLLPILMSHAGAHEVLSILARPHGLEVSDPGAVADGDIIGGAFAAQKHVGELASVMLDALADGLLDAEELAELRRVVADSLGQLRRLERGLAEAEPGFAVVGAK